MKILREEGIPMRDKTVLQALILGVGQVAAKILSLAFLFRFANDLGKDGMSLYVFAYVPFSLFADLSCFGLIPGTSKLVSKMLGDQENDKIPYLLKRGTIYCILAGICFFLFMLFFSRQILSVSLFDGYTEETFEVVRMNLLFASISLFIIPLLNFYKGFLQGHLIMYPSCISIIIENLTKLILYIFAIHFLKNMNLIYVVFLIYFLGYFLGLLVLLVKIIPFYKCKKEKFHAVPLLLKTSIPFGIATMFFTIYQFIDSLTLSILLPVEGYYTAYMFETVRLIFFPIVIAQALGGALNPKMNYMFKEDRIEEAKHIASLSSNLIIFILIPLMIVMRYFAEELYGIFYQQENGGQILYHISTLIIFFGLYKVLIGLSLGLPKAHYIIISTLFSAALKYTLNYLFIPHMGYMGAIYSTIISVTLCILSAYYVLHKEGIHLFWINIKSVFFSFLAVFISAFLVVIFRVCFSLVHYPMYLNILLYSILLLGLYYVFLVLIKQTKTLRIK